MRLMIVPALVLAVALAGCDLNNDDNGGASSASTVVDVAASDDRFETLVTAIEAAGLVETLEGEGPFTVFAPTDEAFDALPEGTLDALLENTAALSDILLYHVVPGEVTSDVVVTLDSAETALGEEVRISSDEDGVRVNDARVVVTDIQADNGVIHVIDAVLLPPEG